MDIQDLLKESLSETDSNLRMAYVLKAAKKLSEQLPFPTVMKLLQKSKILKYLLIATVIFKKSVNTYMIQLPMLLNALQERYADDEEFIKLYFESCKDITIDSDQYSSFVYENQGLVKLFLLHNTQDLISKFSKEHKDSTKLGLIVVQFYKQFIQFNGDNLELLNECFSQALQTRDQFHAMKQVDPFFEQDIEEQLVAMNMQSPDQSRSIKKDQMSPTSPHHQGLNKQEVKQAIIEDWLFTPCETPLLTVGIVPSDQLGSDTFKSKYSLEVLVSFLVWPMKFPQISKFNIQNISLHFEELRQPSFRSRVRIPTERLHMIQFRAFRAMQALTDVRNHFLITQVHTQYYSRTFNWIYYALHEDGFAINFCPDLLVQYLQHLLYYEPDIGVYFMLNYNIPFKLMLYMDIPSVSSFLLQLVRVYNVAPYHRLPLDQVETIWKYLELTEFFQDLLNMSLFDEKTIELVQYKSTQMYKPKTLGVIIRKPNTDPMQVEKVITTVDQKRVAEEIENLPNDIDLIKGILKQKQSKVQSIFQRMLDKNKNDQPIIHKRRSLLDPDHQASSPVRRTSTMTPKLANLFQRKTCNPIRVKNLDTRSMNIFTIVEEAISSGRRQIKEITETVAPTMFQRFITKKPSKLIELHTRSASLQRMSRLGSLIISPSKTQISTSSRASTNRTIIKRFNHLIGSITEKDLNFNVYPPELKDVQMKDFEMQALDPKFIELCSQNEYYTRGALEFLSDVTLNIIIGDTELAVRQRKWQIIAKDNQTFLNAIKKNYFLKQKYASDDSTCILAGKLFNILLKKNPVVQFQFKDLDFLVLTKLLASTIIQMNLKVRELVLLESFIQILEITKDLNTVSVTLWHLILENYTIHQNNNLFFNIFQRILTVIFLYSNHIVFNRVLLKLNMLNYLKSSIHRMKKNALILYTTLKYRDKAIQNQIALLSPWDSLLKTFQKYKQYNSSEIQQINAGNLQCLFQLMKPDEVNQLRLIMRQKQKS